MKKRITDIQIEKESASYRLLFLNNERFCSVDPCLITKFGLRIGLEIEEEVLQKLIEADEAMRAKNFASNLLLERSYSKQQMIDQLARNGFSRRTIDTTLEDLERLNHIKDEKYARNWVNYRQRSKPRGKKMLAHELANKGIDKTTVDGVLEKIGDDEETKIALQLAQKQAIRYRSLPPHVAKRRLHGFLLRRGFGYETIQSTIAHVLREG